MDQYRDQASTILREAERGLRKALATASDDGQYEAVRYLANLAQRISELIPAGNDTSVEQVSSTKEASTGQSRRTRARGKTAKPKGAKPKPTGYPRFAAAGENLVKVGWSKSEGGEYEHKAPKRVVDALATRIEALAEGGRRFTMDEILPLKDPADKSEVPTYQAYLSLAWFRSRGLVSQHGRQGYSIRRNVSLVDAIDSEWSKLPPHTSTSDLEE